MDGTFSVLPKKSLPSPRSSRLFPMLTSRNFMVLHYILQSVIHFKLIFVKGIRSVSRIFFFFLHLDVQLLKYHLLKRLHLLHCIAFAACQRSADSIYIGLFMDSLFCSIYQFFHQYDFVLVTVAS